MDILCVFLYNKNICHNYFYSGGIMKKIISIFFTLCFVLSLTLSVFAQGTPKVVNTNVTINGKAVTFDKPILNIDGSTYFPMRELLNKLGVEDKNITWYEDMRYVQVYYNGQIIIIDVDSPHIVKNGVEFPTTNKPYIYKGSTYLPIRPVATVCDYKVAYDEKTRTINVKK